MDSFDIGIEDGIKIAGLRRTQRLAKARLKAHKAYKDLSGTGASPQEVGKAIKNTRDSKARLIRASRKMDRRARRYRGGAGAYEHTMDFSSVGGKGTPIDASELIGRMKPSGPQGVPKTRASRPIWKHMLRGDLL